MSPYERQGSGSASPEREVRPRSRHEDDKSHRRHEHRSRRDQDHDRNRTRKRSYSPDHEHDRHDRRKKQRSLSPESDDNEPSRHRKHNSRHHRDRSRSPRDSHSHRHRHRSRSRSRSPKSTQALSRRGPLPSQAQAFSKDLDPSPATSTPLPEKQKPNFAPTGKLAAATNTIKTANQTILLKYHEPPESRKPPAKDAWRIYVFKDSEIIDTIPLAEQSCWLFGREAAVADVALEHPSASGQHAVVQFRYVEKRGEFGERVGRVRPYVIDLESGHGTWVNGERIPETKYMELRDKDVVKFGMSRREYVVQLPKG